MENRRHASFIYRNKNISIIEDTYLLAGLLTFSPNITYNPIVDRTGNVSFEVHGQISDAMGRFYAGEEASLVAYTKNLKILRAAIFALKRSVHEMRCAAGSNGGYVQSITMSG